MSGAIAQCLNTPGGRFILNAPPRSFKSFVGSIALPAFVLARNPAAKIMIVAGSQGLARSLQQRLGDLLVSPSYRSLNPHVEAEVNGMDIATRHGGRVSYVVIGHRIMGRGADLIVIDDPQTSEAAANETEQQNALRWVRNDLLSRLDKKSQGQVFLVMQRLAIGDLTERLDDGTWQKLVLQAVAERNEFWPMPDGRKTFRKKGKALCPAIEDLETLRDQLSTLDAMAFSAQYQQKPLARETRCGMYFLEDVTNYQWTPDGPLPREGMLVLREARFIEYELFGVGDPPPVPARALLTEEQWEISAIRQQQRLIASCKEIHAK